MTETNSGDPQLRRSWSEAVQAYLHPRVLVMLFLGFAAGLPFLLVFSTLTFWLAELDIEKATIGYFSWIGITYSIKVFWAPIVDRVPLPGLTAAMGKRRSWMILAQLGIAGGLIGMALTDPSASIEQVAFFALLVAFSSATQDITIDAYRIEAVEVKLQGAMAATYQFGYRVALIVAGAGTLYLAELWSWPIAYFAMAACVGVGVITVLLIDEPEHALEPIARLKDPRVALTVAKNFMLIAALLAGVGGIGITSSSTFALQGVFGLLIFLSLALIYLSVLARTSKAPTIVGWFNTSVIEPFMEFFTRFGLMTLVILLFVAAYRLSDISMGSMANVLYADLGYEKVQVANVAKFYGVIVTIIGTFIGGLLVARYGVSRTLVLGAVLVSAANLAFAWLATQDAEIRNLMVAISADNFSGGLAGTVFIAYLSSLVNKAYSATQYALFSSLFTLPGKIIAGFSGVIVENMGFVGFFIYVAALGVPAILLAATIIPRIKGKPAAQTTPAPA